MKMNGEERIVATLDIGASGIRAMICQVFDDDSIYYLGSGVAPADGIRRGVIVNMEKVTRSISTAVSEAEAMANVSIDSILVGLSGEHIRSFDSQGVVNVSRSDNEIGMSDVQRALDTARDVVIPPDREIIHVIPKGFAVDDQFGVRNVIGMSGSRLEVDAHVVTAASSTVKNIFRAFERCDLRLGGLALESVAACHSALTETEQELGIALIDLGGDTTELAVSSDGCVCYTGSVPLGGQNVTNDIAIGLRTTVEEAERLKLNHGLALASQARPSEMMEVEAVGGRPSRQIARSVLSTIIEARMEEIFTLIGHELRRSNQSENLAGGVTLIGGGALLPGIVDLAEQVLNLPTKVSHPSGVENMPEALEAADAATLQGLTVYAIENDVAAGSHGRGFGSIMKKVENWITGQF